MMNIFSGRRFLDGICFGLLFLLMTPRLSFAQASEMESLRALVQDMQQQLQKALSRIDQLEREKNADIGQVGPSGKIGSSGAKRTVDLKPGDWTGSRWHRRALGRGG